MHRLTNHLTLHPAANCDASKNEEYSGNINCQPQCGDILPANCAHLGHSDGCRCKANFFELSGKCVTEADCGCKYDVATGTISMMVRQNVRSELRSCV